MTNINEDRRTFLGRTLMGAAALPLLLKCGYSSNAQIATERKLDLLRKNAVQDPNCEWCGAREVPDDVRWKTRLIKDGDPGDPLIVTGTVFKADGKTPAPDTLIYFYHTDTEGIYGRPGQPRHGRYRGWVLTGEDGKYGFYTVKPEPYPSRNNAAHIHMTVTGLDRKEDWIDTIFFEGDELLTARDRRISKGGFNHVIGLNKDADGVFQGTRDILLEMV